MTSLFGALFFALIAAVGNAMFAAGQKKVVVEDGPLSFMVLTSVICVILAVVISPFIGSSRYGEVLRENWQWVTIGGVGLFLTYLGFYLLYSRYGTTSYVLYAVLSILTTSLIVGLWLFKETFNSYHWAAFVCALLTVVLFSLGNKYKQPAQVVNEQASEQHVVTQAIDVES
ncbi:EamA family transporter [Vibrio sp. 99-8-1]|uniref:EamA family transporter n=1 Tax=Vibrio sp. 99-8-1 TaxID=2607602 RepID=UPI00149357E5|nr:EamA family transporter [Vibrio sp. 99-8-1]NOI67806.1 EamA family transporter [Vibrio sp. 99-8-1]